MMWTWGSMHMCLAPSVIKLVSDHFVPVMGCWDGGRFTSPSLRPNVCFGKVARSMNHKQYSHMSSVWSNKLNYIRLRFSRLFRSIHVEMKKVRMLGGGGGELAGRAPGSINAIGMYTTEGKWLIHKIFDHRIIGTKISHILCSN